MNGMRIIKDKKGFIFPYWDINPRKHFPLITVTLIALNVIIFIFSLSNFDNIISTFGFVPAYFSILTIFTSMFLHGGLAHIFGNMWYLWIFGDNIEDILGKGKYLFLYFMSGIGATFTHLITNLGSFIPAIGASGAISGILGSYIVLFPHAKIRVRFGHLPAYVVVGLWFIMQLLFATTSLFGGSGSGIAFWAHVGGFASGYILTKLIHKTGKKKKAI